MRRHIAILSCLFALCSVAGAKEDKPLRVFLQDAGIPAATNDLSARFLEDWTRLLQGRGVAVEGSRAFPNRKQLSQTDVLLLHAVNPGSIAAEDRKNLLAFVKRGGGLVILSDSLSGPEAAWFKPLVGGGDGERAPAGAQGSVWGLYIQDRTHPVTQGVASFDLRDRMVPGLNLLPEAKALAIAFTSTEKAIPQMWSWERKKTRAFAWVQGQAGATFQLPHGQGLILRAIAWTGQRDADLLTSIEERASFSYPEGGPTHPLQAGRKIRVQPAFDLQLVAAEPAVVHPVAIDWDASGRLWVACAPDFPVAAPNSPARAQILFLEDSDWIKFRPLRSAYCHQIELHFPDRNDPGRGP